MRILIADDNPINIKLLRAQLEAEDLTVLDAADGEQALAVLNLEPVDAVISDILMPRMDGYQLCHRMRSTQRLKTIPCILYSNTFASDSSRNLALEFGADEFLKKPAPVPDILRVLHEVVRKGHQRKSVGSPPLEYLEETEHYNKHLILQLEGHNIEMKETRETLLEVTHKFLLRTKELENVEEALRKANAELELRVLQRTAELQRSNAELEAFSYSVSHDLRAPLRGIHGYVTMIQEDYAGRLDAEGTRLFNVVSSEAKRMGRLIDDLLAFSQLGRQEMAGTTVDMTSLATTAFASLPPSGGKAGPDFRLKPLPRVWGDLAMLRQVWVNLLGNAAKYSRHQAAPVIEVGAEITDGTATYYVKDNGAGFSMAHAGKLFGVFQRLHSEAEFEGTGVGLALVQRIIHRHGGKVWAEGRPGAGATFFFTLPTGKDS